MTDQGWVKAGELHEGSKVLNSRKEYEVVESIEYKGYNEIEVYNLIVENYHTFFITELGLMVHNIDCKNATLGQIFKQVGDNISDTKIKGDFEDVIKKLDDIAERNNIEEYIKNFDSRFRGLDPNNLDEIKKIISDTSKDIDNHSSSLFKGTEGAAKAEGKIKVPTVKSGEFNDWFNSLSVDELDSMWKNKSTRRAIERQLRAPGGMHEWHLVSRAPQFKNWGVNAEQIRDLRTAISDVEFINPVGKHGQLGSTTAHNELLGIIDSSIDYDMFSRRLNNWANYRLKGGVDSLPEGLRLK